MSARHCVIKHFGLISWPFFNLIKMPYCRIYYRIMFHSVYIISVDFSFPLYSSVSMSAQRQTPKPLHTVSLSTNTVFFVYELNKQECISWTVAEHVPPVFDLSCRIYKCITNKKRKKESCSNNATEEIMAGAERGSRLVFFAVWTSSLSLSFS